MTRRRTGSSCLTGTDLQPGKTKALEVDAGGSGATKTHLLPQNHVLTRGRCEFCLQQNTLHLFTMN